MLSLNQSGAAVNDLAEATRESLACLYAQGFQWLRQPFSGMGHETVVVRTGHTDVHIVVPGDESFVTNGSQHGAGPAVVSDVVRLTNTVYRQKDLQNMLMECFYIV